MVAADSALAYWTGPLASAATLFNSCALDDSNGYPDLYWACGNPGGLHIYASSNAWDHGEQVALQAYVR
jgi:hypothetical protein